ncbi:MAG: M16 family metallopeptidase [Candidatus Methylomirabilales bacterium]
MRNPRSFLALQLATLFALLAVLPAAANQQSFDPVTGVTETVFPSGLKLLVKEVHSAPVVTVWTWYRAGSRNERPGITGISHLLEHMLFRATTSMKTGEIDRLVQLAGGRHNAFTSFDHTAYHITLPAEHLDTALKIEAERMLNCALIPDEVQREIGVVISELQGRMNAPEERLEDVTRATAFLRHPYRTPIIGWKEDVEALTAEAVREYYAAHYQPGNAVLVIVGDVRTAAAVERVAQYFGSLPAGPRAPRVTAVEPPQRGERRVQVRDGGAAAHLQALYRIPPAGHADLYPLIVLDGLLTEGHSSRLHRALVETELAASQSSYLSRRLDGGWLSIYATARDGVPLERVEAALDAALAGLRDEPVGERELQKAINQVKAQHTMARGSVSGLARLLGSTELTVGYRELGRYFDRIRAVSAADVHRVARQYLRSENRTVGWFIPEGPAPAGGPGERVRGSVHRQEDGGDGPAPAASPAAAPGGRVIRRVLANGLVLIAAENRVAPSVAIKGYVRAGPVEDPAGRGGLAFLTADLLLRGTQSHSAAEMAESLDFYGASLGIQAERETVGITAQMLTEHFEPVLGRLAEALRAPVFPADEFAKARAALGARLRRERQDSRERAHMELFARLFPPEHPLHRHPKGRPEEVQQLAREDVVAFHRQFYRPDRTVLVVVSDLAPELVAAAVERLFGDWRAAPGPPERPRPAMPRIQHPAQVIVSLPGKAEAIVMLGGNGITRADPDYYPAFLATRILGGGLGSRLMTALRQQGGMTYGVYSYFHPVLGERPFIISLQTDPTTVDKAVAAARAETARLVSGGITAAELEEARAGAIGSLVLSIEEQMGLAFVLRDTELFGLGLDYPQRFPALLKAVSLDQVQAAARRYIHPDQLIQVVVAPAAP